MATNPNPTVKLQQCLFGYDDGHRLLAGSVRLSDEALSLLLLHSDLVPGHSSAASAGYWTGMPLPAAKIYALMRTWPAPEMPRPGCAWTHVILIALSDIARIPEMAALDGHFVRPETIGEYSAYTVPLHFTPQSLPERPVDGQPFDAALSVLRALYDSKGDAIIHSDTAAIDGVIFSAWSQQWPKLRRTFSFRTAGSVATSSDHHFDVRIIRDAATSAAQARKQRATAADWESAAIEDMQHPHGSSLRRFLWRYGSDVRNGREAYRSLVHLYLKTRVSNFGRDAFADVVDRVDAAFPQSDEAKLLKSDLLSLAPSPFSLVPQADAVTVLGYLIDRSADEDLELPKGISAQIGQQWLHRAHEIVALTGTALNVAPRLGQQLALAIATSATPDTFFSLTEAHPAVRHQVLHAKPSLLDSPELQELRNDDRSLALQALPDDQELAGRIIDRVLLIDDRATAEYFVKRFPALARSKVRSAITAELHAGQPQVRRAWTKAAYSREADLINELLVSITTTTALSAFAQWLGMNVREGLKASVVEWAKVIERAEDDVSGPDSQRLDAFLLALALADPRSGCEPLFERCFADVHEDIYYSRLPYDGFSSLAKYLPTLYWWQQSDTCLRLRIAVVRAYVDGRLNPSSFRALAPDKRLQVLLADTAAYHPGARRYLDLR